MTRANTTHNYCESVKLVDLAVERNFVGWDLDNGGTDPSVTIVLKVSFALPAESQTIIVFISKGAESRGTSVNDEVCIKSTVKYIFFKADIWKDL